MGPTALDIFVNAPNIQVLQPLESNRVKKKRKKASTSSKS